MKSVFTAHQPDQPEPFDNTDPAQVERLKHDPPTPEEAKAFRDRVVAHGRFADIIERPPSEGEFQPYTMLSAHEVHHLRLDALNAKKALWDERRRRRIERWGWIALVATEIATFVYWLAVHG